MSRTADAYFEKTIARFRKVLSPAIIPISLQEDIPNAPIPRKELRPTAILHSSDDTNKLSKRKNTRKIVRKTIESRKLVTQQVAKEPKSIKDPKSVEESKSAQELKSAEESKASEESEALEKLKSVDGSKISVLSDFSLILEENSVDWNSSEIVVYPCEHQSKPWRWEDSSAQMKKRPMCHCSLCKEPQCPGRNATQSNKPECHEYPGYPVEWSARQTAVDESVTGRSNIATYTDTCTMTVQHTDAAADTSQLEPPDPPRPAAPDGPRDAQPPQADPADQAIAAGTHGCQRDCPFYQTGIDVTQNGTIREYIMIQCPNCHQTVTTPLDDESNKYELVSMHQRRCYVGFPQDTDMRPLLKYPLHADIDQGPRGTRLHCPSPNSSPESIDYNCLCSEYRESMCVTQGKPRRRTWSPNWSPQRARRRSCSPGAHRGRMCRASSPVCRERSPPCQARLPPPCRDSAAQAVGSRYHEHCTRQQMAHFAPLPPVGARRRVVASARPCHRQCHLSKCV